jgi:hypothetical protein
MVGTMQPMYNVRLLVIIIPLYNEYMLIKMKKMEKQNTKPSARTTSLHKSHLGLTQKNTSSKTSA